MRTVIPFLLLAIPLLPGCHKKPLICCEPPMVYSFNGNWRLVQYSGGLAGRTTNVSLDSVVLNLNTDWTYTKLVRGQQGDSGRYNRVQVPLPADGDTTGLIFSSDTSMIWLFRANGDSLVLHQYVTDGFQYVYLKILPQ